jgi:glyoxylase-like metal-dependent hydrolase (beta-lactamase superfamily II)/8-oxo-dGTP pyrophosphatase MutT (NUDIX family)
MNPPDPRPAATLVLLRDAPAGMQVLLTTRPRTMKFMAGAVVFPGGAVAPADLDPRWREASRRSPADAADALGMDDGRAALGTFVCALREAFEEVGFLLGDGPLERLRRADADVPHRFLEACLDGGIVLGTDDLVPAGRWVTPPGSPVRFDARFFLAAVPEGWEPVPDPREVAACRWAAPAAALDDLAAGRALMAPPTIEMLQRLSGFDSVAAALSSPASTAPAILSVGLSPLVHVVLAPNAGIMTGPGTNTYVVGSGRCVVIDPAVDDDVYLDAVVAAAPGGISEILVTHRHPDHVGGVAALTARTSAPVRAYGDAPAGGIGVAPLYDGGVVEAAGVRLEALHTPGHARDHLCFLLDGRDLFSGDVILGEGTSVIAPPDGDMDAFIATLRRLGAIGLGRIYPGHFRSLDRGDEVVHALIEHREQRAAAILDALDDESRTPAEIVATVYGDTPPVLHPVAEYSVLAHLESAERDGLVERTDDGWRRR